MKTYHNLYPKILSYSARVEAYKKALIGKKDKKRIKGFTGNPQQTIDDMYDWVLYYKPPSSYTYYH